MGLAKPAVYVPLATAESVSPLNVPMALTVSATVTLMEPPLASDVPVAQPPEPFPAGVVGATAQHIVAPVVEVLIVTDSGTVPLDGVSVGVATCGALLKTKAPISQAVVPVGRTAGVRLFPSDVSSPSAARLPVARDVRLTPAPIACDPESSWPM